MSPPRRRLALLVLLAAAAALYLTLAPRWPHDQVVHIVLGDAGSQVDELRLGYRPASTGSKDAKNAEDWTREVAFRFAGGSGPRVVTHEPRLADGDYVVEIEIVTSSHRNLEVQRRVTLQGGTTSIDVSDAMRTAPAVSP